MEAIRFDPLGNEIHHFQETKTTECKAYQTRGFWIFYQVQTGFINRKRNKVGCSKATQHILINSKNNNNE